MDKKIQKLLEENKIKFKAIDHKKVYTAFTEAATQHVDPKTVVKTVFIKFSKPTSHMLKDGSLSIIDSCLIAVPAKNRVNLKKIAKAVNIHSDKRFKLMKKENPKAKAPPTITVKMASEKDILKKLKTKVGLLHPFATLFKLPLFIDKKLSKNRKIIVSAGSYIESLEINYKDLVKITPHMEGNFTE